MDFAIAVKAFIPKDGKMLLIKRRKNDVHNPGKWDTPGGRLEHGENPFKGLKREVREETSLEVEVKQPLGVHHFTRDDGQKITMITFLCEAKTENVKLSEEHTEYDWFTTGEARDKLHDAYREELERYEDL